MPHKHIRRLTGKNRSKDADMQLGLILAFVAGAINAGGFLAVGQYTSHMTGIVSAVADFIALESYALAFSFLLFLFAFIGGAAVSAIIINWARQRNYHSEYALPLMLEAVLLFLFGMNAAGMLESSLDFMIALLCFIMGLQNALITKISNSEIRTTHVTGLATDIGIELGRFFYSCIYASTVKMRREKIRLYSLLLVFFLIGGIVGAIAFSKISFAAVVPLSFLLFLLALVPIIDDMRAK